MTTDEPTCTSRVYWWDGEYEGDCELLLDHDGLHHDGLSWWDDLGDMVEPVSPKAVLMQETLRGIAAAFQPAQVAP
jgi:hypothetical protein